MQWFSYRKKNRERPNIGDHRPLSKLGDIQPDRWLAEYTTELLNVLNVLALLLELEPHQANSRRRSVKDKTLRTGDDIIAGIAGIPIEELAKEPTESGKHLISVDELRAAGALDVPASWRKTLGGGERDLFSDLLGDEENPEKEQPARVELDERQMHGRCLNRTLG